MWRNSQNKLLGPKGNSRLLRRSMRLKVSVSSSRKRVNAISRVSADNSASSSMPKLYAK
jgi:hypothetical protein